MKIHALAAAAIAVTSISLVHAQTIWTAGHGDIGVGFHDGALEPHWHLGEDGEEVVLDGVTQSNDPDGFEFETSDLIAQTGNSFTRLPGSQWDFLGVGAGETVYFFGASESPGTPYLGFGTEELSNLEWGPVTFTLSGVVGPGEFSIYSVFLSSPVIRMSTLDPGVDSFSLDPNTHTHFNIAFSEVGTYAVTFDISGTQTLGGVPTDYTSTATYTFNVVPEPGSAALFLMAGAGLLLRRRTRQA